MTWINIVLKPSHECILKPNHGILKPNPFILKPSRTLSLLHEDDRLPVVSFFQRTLFFLPLEKQRRRYTTNRRSILRNKNIIEVSHNYNNTL